MSTASPRPQLSLDELRRLKWLLGGLLALISLWTVFFLDVEALALVGVAAALITAALVWPQLPGRVPALAWRLVVPVIILAAVADWWFTKETLPVLIRLGVLLVLYRATGYRRQREDLQLIVLGLFLVVVAGVLTVSLGFAFLLLLFTASALGYLFVITLIDLTENTRVALTYEEMGQCPPWARVGWGRLFSRLREVADWRLLGFSSALFLLVVLMSAGLFVVIPRFEIATGFFLDKYITRKSHTGFNETVRFGDVGELVKDESVAMRVDVTDAASIREVPYWRLVVLEEYTPQGFHVATSLKNDLLRSQINNQFLRGRVGQSRTAPAVGGIWTLYVEPGVSRYLPLPGSFGMLRLRETVPVQSYPLAQIVALRTEAMAMTAYQLESVELSPQIRDTHTARLLSRHGGTVPNGPDAPIVLQGPRGQANEAALASIVREITHGAPMEAAEFARQASIWLRNRHAYALAARIPSGPQDDIVKWVASNEPGFCEYFASALTVLCRAAGHPARVVAGFHGGSLNAYESYFMVKNSDAHAWTEVYDGRSSWLRVDATPGTIGQVEGPGAKVEQEKDSSWSARFDSLRVIWYRRIVSFDSRQQVQMIDEVRTFTTDTGTAMRARLEVWGKQFRSWLAGPWNWQRLARAAGVVVATLTGVSLLLLGLRHGWSAWQGWRRPGEYDPVRREAGRWLVSIAERARKTTAESGTGRDTLAPVVLDLQRLRFGRRETWPEPRSVFRQARQARRQLGR